MKSCIILGVIVLLFIWNIFSFFVCAIDKSLAKRKKRRIREAFMIRISVFFGSFGMLLGMLLFRHKIRKPLFYISVPLLLTAQIGLFFTAYYFLLRH